MPFLVIPFIAGVAAGVAATTYGQKTIKRAKKAASDVVTTVMAIELPGTKPADKDRSSE